MKKASIILMLITIITKISGFLRELTLSYFYGATNISDAYIISMTIPLIVFDFIGLAISTTYIPLFNLIEKKDGYQVAHEFTNNLLNIVFVWCIFFSILGLFFTKQIVHFFAPGFSSQTLNIAASLTRISIFGSVLTTSIYIFSGYLRTKDSYKIVTLRSIPRNIIIILSIYLSSIWDLIILAIGSFIAIITELIILLIWSFNKGWRYKIVFDFKNQYIKKMLILSMPVVLGTSINQINKIVDKTLASKITEGGISALNYAIRLDLFIHGVFVLSITTIMYPLISRFAASNEYNNFKKIVTESLNGVLFLIMPVSIGTMIFANEIIMFIYGRGAFNDKALYLTSTALFFYSIGMVGYGLRDVLSRTFYSLQDTKTPMINAAFGMIINIILNIVLAKILGLGGLALATSISALVTTLLLMISLKRKIGTLNIIGVNFFKILFASISMGLISKKFYIYFNGIIKNDLLLISAIILGVFIYFVLVIFLRVNGVSTIVKAIKKKIHL